MKNRRNKECLITERDLRKLELSWDPRQLDEAFGGAYRRYRIDEIEGMDIDTFFSKTKRFLMDLLSRETRHYNFAPPELWSLLSKGQPPLKEEKTGH